MTSQKERPRRQIRQSLGGIAVALIVATSVALTGCGSDEGPRRSNFDQVIAPERCGGSGGGPC